MQETVAPFGKATDYSFDNGAGWTLQLYRAAGSNVHGKKPVLIVPGYGMNSFIFSFHPRGLSLMEYLAQQGLEVWRVDLRGQGEARYHGNHLAAGVPRANVDPDNFRLDDLAVTDLGAAVDAVLQHTQTGCSRVDMIGASLGGTLILAHAALAGTAKLGGLVTIGSPVRWVKVNPIIKVLASAPALVGEVRMRGTRRLAQVVLPLLTRFAPDLLRIYLNPTLTDTSRIAELMRTVENPNRYLNRQIAVWIHRRDLTLRRQNISQALQRIDCPSLTILASHDGIVPPATARYSHDKLGSKDKTLLEVGSATVMLAHADLFISDVALERVYGPLSEWLLGRQSATSLAD